MTGHTRGSRLAWTDLGVRMGYTREAPQREHILAAVARMTWTDDLDRVPYLTGPVVHALVRVLAGRHHPRLRSVGVAQLDGSQLLIGLHLHTGQRSYFLDLDSEAIHVLNQTCRPTAAARGSQVA
jgi:hypothetical protein